MLLNFQLAEVSVLFKNVTFRDDKIEPLSFLVRTSNTVPNVNGYPAVVDYDLRLYSGPIGFFFIDTWFVKYSVKPIPARLFLGSELYGWL